MSLLCAALQLEEMERASAEEHRPGWQEDFGDQPKGIRQTIYSAYADSFYSHSRAMIPIYRASLDLSRPACDSSCSFLTLVLHTIDRCRQSDIHGC